MKTLIILTSLIWGLFANAEIVIQPGPNALEGKEGGNGQLTVIPRGETQPVPYEAVRAWETGKYLNFYRLPNVNGRIEPRGKFNKMYGVYALEWLDHAKELSPQLYQDLIRAAKNTSFRIINEFITWQHAPYPQGAVDYKTFEKAAFYNGEIILSTPVMDKVGPLNGNLTVQQNQGFIVVHELINAAYPKLSVAHKLAIGEALVRAKIFNDSQLDFYYNLGTIDSYFITLLDNRSDFESILNELIHYAKAPRLMQLQVLKDVGSKYAYSSKKLSEVFVDDVLGRIRDIKNAKTEIEDRLNIVYTTLRSIRYNFQQPLLDLDSLKKISQELRIPLFNLLTLRDPVTKKDFMTDGAKVIIDVIQADFAANRAVIIAKGIAEENLRNQVYYYHSMLSSNDEHRSYAVIEKGLKTMTDTNNLGTKNLISESAKQIVAVDPVGLRQEIMRSYNNAICKSGLCVDEARTIQYLYWFAHVADPMENLEFPFKRGDRFFNYENNIKWKVIEPNSYQFDDYDRGGQTKDKDRNEVNGFLVNIVKYSNSKKQSMTILRGDQTKGRYALKQIDPNVYGIHINLKMLFFLK